MGNVPGENGGESLMTRVAKSGLLRRVVAGGALVGSLVGCGTQMRNPHLSDSVEIGGGMNALTCQDYTRKAAEKLGLNITSGESTTTKFPGREGQATRAAVSCDCGEPGTFEGGVRLAARELAAANLIQIEKPVDARFPDKDDGLAVDELKKATLLAFCAAFPEAVED